jgi:hypothetical protein
MAGGQSFDTVVARADRESLLRSIRSVMSAAAEREAAIAGSSR